VKVAPDSRSNVFYERICDLQSRFRPEYGKPMTVPVDILELKVPDLSRTKAVNCQEKHDGTVTEIQRLLRVSTFQ
jgi:hypothetical protein